MCYFANDLLFHRPVRGKELLDHAAGEVDARLGEHGVDDFAGALELSAAGGVVTKARAAKALLVLGIAQLARFLVAVDELKQLLRDVG